MKTYSAADAVDQTVLGVQCESRLADHCPEGRLEGVTHVAVFDGDRFLSVVTASELALASKERIFADLYDKIHSPTVVTSEASLDGSVVLSPPAESAPRRWGSA